MKSKKNRIKLSDLEQEGGGDHASSSYIPSKASSARKKIAPKKKQKSSNSLKTIKNSNDTSEAPQYEDSLFEVDKSPLILWLGKWRKCIQKTNSNKWVRRFHLALEVIYFILVLFYLYFIMEIEENDNTVLITLMMTFLSLCLMMYIMNIVENWKDPELIVDIILIIFTIALDINEIVQRKDGKGYYRGGNQTLYNIDRVLRGLMIQRRASNFMQEVKSMINSKVMTKKLRRKNSVTEMISEIMFFLGQDDKNTFNRESAKFVKKGLNHVKDLVMAQRIKKLEKSNQEDNDKFGYNHHERMDEAEELDRCVYELDPDREEHRKAFQYEKGLKDDKVSRLLNKIEDYDFDIFELRSATGGNELVTVINYLMDLNDFHTKLKIAKEKFREYSIVIQGMYNPIAYHNKTHASDVCQTCYYFMTTWKFRERGQLSDLEQCVLLISGFVHDTDHPGYNNQYMVATRDRIALRYNDKSWLENHHISVAFSTMLKSTKTRIFEKFTNEEFKIMRTNMIDLVLATDNIRHFSDLNYLKQRIASPEFEPSNKDKKEITNYLIHLADISNPTKPWKLWYKWIDLLFVEFFHQGDKEKEKGLPISFLMDRFTTNIAKAQSGFIDNFIRPAFEVLSEILPETKANLLQMEENKSQWRALEGDYDPANKFTQKELEDDKIIEEDEELSYYSQEDEESDGYMEEEEEEEEFNENDRIYKSGRQKGNPGDLKNSDLTSSF